MAEPDVPAIRALLRRWLDRRLEADGRDWVAASLARLAAAASEPELVRALDLAVGLASRRAGKRDLSLDPADLAEADRARPGWDPRDLSCDQAARLLFVLATVPDDAGSAGQDEAGFVRRLERLWATADVGELVAFLRGLPLYPDPARHVARAAEGVRSNMTAVFRAVAHDNPYPAERFSEATWNHMILKALFVGVPLAPVHGLDRRANPDLARMLVDYARERRAARRPVPVDLWRCVGPHADDAALAELADLLRTGDPQERAAAALALAACPHPDAPALLAGVPDLAGAVATGRITWDGLVPGSTEGEAR
ncbi:EboA domain-containing protein [Arenibaculum sp.]|jgi:hypothetical protein|uniref:EboA domain-containing protein n=1 Tax=Arenibaculum sp. TaxID=2865862 RepID=UPI002E0F9B56|nr:EboA domain-containing protein [Arenibaculum sp.]